MGRPFGVLRRKLYDDLRRERDELGEQVLDLRMDCEGLGYEVDRMASTLLVIVSILDRGPLNEEAEQRIRDAVQAGLSGSDVPSGGDDG